MSGVTVVINTAGPLLARVKSEVQRAGLALVAARAVAIQTKDHLVKLNAERHKHGRGYYLQAARSVTSRSGGPGLALVTVTQTGFRQRLKGGRIAPKNGEYLTLPARPEAHGKRAREFADLDFAFAMDERGRLRPALVQRLSTAISLIRRKRKDGTVSLTVKPGEVQGGKPMFWLVREVNQRPDPTVLPTEAETQETATAAIRRRVERLEQSS